MHGNHFDNITELVGCACSWCAETPAFCSGAHCTLRQFISPVVQCVTSFWILLSFRYSLATSNVGAIEVLRSTKCNKVLQYTPRG